MTIKSIQNYPAPFVIVQAGWITPAQVTLDGTTCFAYSIVPTSNPFSGSMSMNEIRVNFTNPSGNPQVTPYLYSDSTSTAKPDAVVLNGTGSQSAVLSTGFSSLTFSTTKPTLTEGVRQWVVLKLTAGTSIRVNHLTVPALWLGIYGPSGGANGRNETASGVDGAWAGTQYADVAGVRIGITDGTDTAYWGMPVSAPWTGLSGTSSRIDGTQSVGTTITIPDNATFRIRTFVCVVIKVGAPGNLTASIHNGTTVIATATSAIRYATDVSTASFTTYQFDFNPAVELAGGSTYRIVINAASGSNAANYYYLYGVTSLDTDAISLGLNRWGNHLTVLSGGAWTDTTSSLISFAIILDMTTGPFVSSGGSNIYKTAVGDLGALGVRRLARL